MRLYRAVCLAELDEIRRDNAIRPGPPSFQGKWFLTSVEETAEMGRRLFRIGNPPFHIVEAEVSDSDLGLFFRDPFRDGIGIGYYAYVEQLDRVRFVREVSDVPLRRLRTELGAR